MAGCLWQWKYNNAVKLSAALRISSQIASKKKMLAGPHQNPVREILAKGATLSTLWFHLQVINQLAALTVQVEEDQKDQIGPSQTRKSSKFWILTVFWTPSEGESLALIIPRWGFGTSFKKINKTCSVLNIMVLKHQHLREFGCYTFKPWQAQYFRSKHGLPRKTFLRTTGPATPSRATNYTDTSTKKHLRGKPAV